LTPEFERYIAPARAKPQFWRLCLGMLLIVLIYLAWLFMMFGAIWLIAGADQVYFWSAQVTRPSSPSGVLILFGGFVGAAIAPVIAARVLHNRPAGTLFGRRVRVLRDFCKSVLVVLLVYSAFLVIWSLWFDAVPNLQPGIWLRLLPVALTGLLVQTLAEELIFRGYLQQQLAARFKSPIIWMLVPSLLFASLHFDPSMSGENTWLIVATTGMFGLVASDLTRVTGSLGAAWGFHFANNFLTILLISVDGTITGVALYVTPYSSHDTTVLPVLILVDFLVMGFAWLLLRLVLRR